MNVQFAFQGGGAKFVNLLAAASAIQDRQKNGDITVTRVSGTSAGSIVASIVASKAPVEKIGGFLINEGANFQDKIAGEFANGFNPWSINKIPQSFPKIQFLSIIGKLRSGEAFFSNVELLNFLTEMYTQSLGYVPDTIHDAEEASGTKLIISSSNIDKAEGEKFFDKDPFIRSIVNSCALPFIFRSTSDLKNNPYVDGGLCDNLPAEILSENKEDFGEILAISFKRTPDPFEKPTFKNSTLDYLLKLFDASMNNNIMRTKQILGDSNFLNIDSTLNTLDFKSALTQHYKKDESEAIIETETFKEIKSKVGRWIDGHTKIHNTRSNYTLGGLTGMLTPEENMFTLGRLYKKHFNKSDWHFAKSSLIVYADNIQQNNEQFDRIDRKFQICPGDLPIECVAMHANTSGNPTSPIPTNISLKYKENKKPIKFEVIPSLGNSDAIFSNKIECLLYLDKPVSKTVDNINELILDSEYIVDCVMFPPDKNNYDTLSFRNTRKKSAEIVDVILAIPKGFTPLKVSCDEENGQKRGIHLNEEYIYSEYNISRVNYDVYGMQCKKLRKDDRFVVGFTKTE